MTFCATERHAFRPQILLGSQMHRHREKTKIPAHNLLNRQLK